MASESRHEPGIHNSAFSITCQQEKDIVLITLLGSCSMNVADELSDRIREAAQPDVRLMIIDMAEVDFIESTCLGGIVSAYLRLRRHQGQIRLAAPRPPIKHLLELTLLTQLLPVFDSVEAAKA